MDVEKKLEEMKKSIFSEYNTIKEEKGIGIINDEDRLTLFMESVNKKLGQFYELLEFLCK